MAFDLSKLQLDVPELIEMAKSKDLTSAQKLLRIASETIVAGKPLPSGLDAWISEGLAELAESEKPEKAVLDVFSLHKPNLNKKFKEEMERWVAQYVYWSKQGHHKAVNATGTSAGAYQEAAEHFDLSPNTVEKYYKKHRDNIDLPQVFRTPS